MLYDYKILITKRVIFVQKYADSCLPIVVGQILFEKLVLLIGTEANVNII